MISEKTELYLYRDFKTEMNIYGPKSNMEKGNMTVGNMVGL